MKEIDLPLGKHIRYPDSYDSKQLVSIPRELGRKESNINMLKLPFKGVDIWNCYELSWLNNSGKPEVRLMSFIVPYDSFYLVESKSVKLYLNSFNNTKFADDKIVSDTITRDLSEATKSQVAVRISSMVSYHNARLKSFTGKCLDNLDIHITEYSVDSSILSIMQDGPIIEEQLYSDLLKSNCPVTGQPDWASVFIKYKGKKINHESL